MKRTTRGALGLALVAGLALPAGAAGRVAPAAAPAAPPKNIVKTAAAAGTFTTLVSLVKQAGLVGALSAPGKLTVFAPTDAAFAKVPKATLTALGKDRAKLRAVLLYHVAKGSVTAKKVVTLSRVPTLQGQRLAVKTPGNRVVVGGARVVKADVRASNGVIHVIDRVLLPPGL